MMFAKIGLTYINLSRVSTIDMRPTSDGEFELQFYFSDTQMENDADHLLFKSEDDGALEFRDWLDEHTVSRPSPEES